MFQISKLKVTGFICCLLLQTQLASGQASTDSQKQIRAAVESKDFKTALTELQRLREGNANIYSANNYDYLQARLSELTGDAPTASSAYQSVVSRKSVLSGHALWHLAQAARRIGDLTLERERLRQLLVIMSSGHQLREATLFRLGESFYESADYDSAISTLQQLNNTGNEATKRQAAVLTGQSYLFKGSHAEARSVFNKLILQMPDASRPDDFALAAVRALDELEQKAAAPATSLSDAERLLRASIYQFNRDFVAARAHFLALVEQTPQSSSVPNALYQIGRGLFLEGNYDEALKYFQRVEQQFPESSSTREALSSMGSTYSRLKRTDEAVAAYKRLIERFPESPNPERPYVNIIDALHEAGRHAPALEWVEQARAQFRNQLGEALALFAQLRIHLAQSNWRASINDIDELFRQPDLGGTRVPSGTTKSELTFVRAYALEQLGQQEAAISLYLSLPEGRNEYYGHRATQRLRALRLAAQTRPLVEAQFGRVRGEAKQALATGQYDQARIAGQLALRLTDHPQEAAELLAQLQKGYSQLPSYKLPAFSLVTFGRQELLTRAAAFEEPSHQALADELFFLGLYDEGVPELIAARATINSGGQTEKGGEASRPVTGASGLTNEDYSLAVYSLRGGLPNRAVRFAEGLWRNVPADFVIEIAPTELVALLYPVPYRDSLLRHSSVRKIDPRFVLSIARQESRFQADAKSVAAARGMMQFIPSTADDIARQLGRKSHNHNELYNPDTAILFGSQYLANLFQQFPEQPQAVASAYNAGPENTARWIGRSRSSEADRYLPEIGFTQTKDYVYKVMSNFWIYERLYDTHLQRNSSGTKP